MKVLMMLMALMVMLLRMLATTSEEIELRELIMQKRSTTGSMVIVAHIDFAWAHLSQDYSHFLVDDQRWPEGEESIDGCS